MRNITGTIPKHMYVVRSVDGPVMRETFDGSKIKAISTYISIKEEQAKKTGVQWASRNGMTASVHVRDNLPFKMQIVGTTITYSGNKLFKIIDLTNNEYYDLSFESFELLMKTGNIIIDNGIPSCTFIWATYDRQTRPIRYEGKQHKELLDLAKTKSNTKKGISVLDLELGRVYYNSIRSAVYLGSISTSREGKLLVFFETSTNMRNSDPHANQDISTLLSIFDSRSSAVSGFKTALNENWNKSDSILKNLKPYMGNYERKAPSLKFLTTTLVSGLVLSKSNPYSSEGKKVDIPDRMYEGRFEKNLISFLRNRRSMILDMLTPTISEFNNYDIICNSKPYNFPKLNKRK